MDVLIYLLLAFQLLILTLAAVALREVRKQASPSGGVVDMKGVLDALFRNYQQDSERIMTAEFLKLNSGNEGHSQRQKDMYDTLSKNVRAFSEWAVASGEQQYKTTDGKLNELRKEMTQGQEFARKEQTESLQQFRGSMQTVMLGMNTALKALTEENNQKLEQVRLTVEDRLVSLQRDNSEKLEKMRSTVEEKLHATLEQRLGENFKRVSDSLETVHRGLGEMQSLAGGVGDLKRVLTNVKLRGSWAEVQLDTLLGELLTPAQHEKNVAVNPATQERVDHAIKLPGTDGTHVWLPIDAKFPQEDYQKFIEASERGDAEAIAAHGRDLEKRILQEARSIKEKYIRPPHTTDFAILFLPTEGLFAEVLRRPGLHEKLLTECRVVVTGPTTLAATLSSLRMGFRTLAIEQRSSEVWQVLGAVKLEFTKFGDILAQVKKKLDQASETIDRANVRTRAMEKQLRGVEALSEVDSTHLLGNLEGSSDVSKDLA